MNTISEPDNALPEVSFEQLPEKLKEAAKRAGWKDLMPVQKKAIPYIIERRDLMIQSRTGSGKTGAFILPIIERIDTTKPECQAIVLVPTRELANQVASEAKLLAGDKDLRTIAVYGGVAYEPQLEAFRKGAHLVVGTPGRILDHLLKRNFKLDFLDIMVFDEADRMLSMGFYPDMRTLQRYLPKNNFSSYMFSATFPVSVIQLAGEFMYNPEVLSLSKDNVHVTEIEHVYYEVLPMQKDRCLVRLIEMENPASAIIFCNRKSEVAYVNTVLQRFGYDSDELTSDLSQNKRESVLKNMRNGKLRFLVATDIAARGIDINDLSHVFQYSPPEDPENYIHRAGRTGRAGASGKAIMLISKIEKLRLNDIEKLYEINIEGKIAPEDSDVENIVGERVTVLLEAKLRTRDKLQTERMQRFISLAKKLGENDDETAVIAMLLDDYYQESLHGKPEQPYKKPQAPQKFQKPNRPKKPRTFRKR